VSPYPQGNTPHRGHLTPKFTLSHWKKYTNDEILGLWRWVYTHFGIPEPELLVTDCYPMWHFWKRKGWKRYWRYEWPFFLLVLWLSFVATAAGWQWYNWQYWLAVVPVWLMASVYAGMKSERTKKDLEDKIYHQLTQRDLTLPKFGNEHEQELG
jgi:hypothetical protein